VGASVLINAGWYKVVEHIQSTITRSAIEAQRAQDAIQTHTAQIRHRYEAAVA